MNDPSFPARDFERVPLVLRHVRPARLALARSLVDRPAFPAEATWWELVDVAASTKAPPVAIAVEAGAADGVVELLAVASLKVAHTSVMSELVVQLVANLRSSGARAITAGPSTGPASAALRVAGFIADGPGRVVLEL